MVTTGAMPVVPFLFRAACEHADALGWYLAPGRTPPRLQEPRTGEVRPAGGRTDIQAASGRANLAGSACAAAHADSCGLRVVYLLTAAWGCTCSVRLADAPAGTPIRAARPTRGCRSGDSGERGGCAGWVRLGGAPAGTPIRAARPTRGCRSGYSRGMRGPGSPAHSAGQRLPPAGRSRPRA